MIFSCPLELKTVSEAGVFTGLASVYGNVDSAGDLVLPGSFAKTLQQGGSERPLLWQHRDPVGVVTLKDSPDGLLATGRLSLGTTTGRDAYQLLKDGAVKGLSIGYHVLKSVFVGPVRQIQEVKLWEVSLVALPANDRALISEVKSSKEADDQIMRELTSFRSDFFRAIQGGR